MTLRDGRLKSKAVLALAGLFHAASAGGFALRGSVHALEAPGIQAEGIAMLAALGSEPGIRLEVAVARLHLEVLALDVPDLRVSCLLRQEQGEWHCRGRGGWRWAEERIEGELALRIAGEKLSLDWQRASAAVQLEADLERGVVSASLAGLPLASLSALGSAVWPALLLQEGTLGGRFVLSLGAEPRLRGGFRIERMAFDTRDGSAGAIGAGMTVRFSSILGAAPRAEVEATISGGEWLLGPLYLALGEDSLALDAAFRVPPAQGLELERLRVIEPGVFTFEGDFRWRPDRAWPDGGISLRVEDAEPFLARRVSSLLSLTGFAGLEGKGSAAIRLRLEQGRLSALGFQADALGLRDPKGRWALEDLRGSFEFSSAPRASESELGGSSAAFFGITAGPWRVRLKNGSRSLILSEASRFEMLGGAVILEEGRIALGPEDSIEASLAVAIEGISLPELAARLDWPPFPGTVSGRLPRAHYRAGRLETEGALEIAVFDGRILARGLSMERPFGTLPTLSADLLLERLDLARITSVFDFGLIEGRLSGRIEGLRLIDWQPVAFSAQLASERSGRRRISQRAVENLAALGGGGAAAALQRGIVGAFSSFAYEELGLSCVLARYVCTMGGVGSAGDGYFILRGRGIPRVDVIGYQREVDWPVLIARLKAALSSGAVVVE